MEKQITGDQQPLGKTPISSPSSNPKGGEKQIIGDTVKLGMTPVASPSANPKSGEFQIIGDKTPLNRTPIKGWGSAGKLPMSERSIKQSQGKY
jgi:hypothetical protein